MNIDTNAVTDAVIASGVGPLQAEQGANLVEAFIKGLSKYPDTQWETVGIEIPWFALLQPKTVAVGVQDRIARDPQTQLWGCEWKSKGAPKLKKDGTPYEGSGEHDWLHEISNDVQLRIYAMAQQIGSFVFAKDDVRQFNVETPHILVRAVVKANPPYLWPTKPEHGQFTFPQPWIDLTRSALINAAEQIRAARRTEGPWALPSHHCTNKFRRLCDYHALFCSKGVVPQGVPTTRDSTDPGWAALEASGVDTNDPEVVVLSASSFSNWLQCAEQYRILISGAAPGEESEALQVGSAMHAGIAQVFRELENERTRKLS